MNYLAHTLLSFQKPDIIVGNFIADSIQGNKFEGLTDGIIKGITLHRKIDFYTDTHPVYLTSKQYFRKEFDKYSGVLVDIIYDHFLAKNFHLYSKVSLQEYASSIYSVLNDYMEYLPENAKRFYGYMTERNILYNYSSLEGIETVLTHLSHRIRHRYELQLAIPTLIKNYKEIEDEFFIFFDDLYHYCETQPEIIG